MKCKWNLRSCDGKPQGYAAESWMSFWPDTWPLMQVVSFLVSSPWRGADKGIGARCAAHVICATRAVSGLGSDSRPEQ
eukprot:5922119-Pyramimonas_sp.AAC.1